MKRLRNHVVDSVVTAERGPTPKHTCICKLPCRRCKKNRPSNASGCFVVVQREESFPFYAVCSFCGIIFNQIKLIPAPVPKRQTSVRITVVEILYYIWSLYVGMDLRATSVGAEVNEEVKGCALLSVLSLYYLVGIETGATDRVAAKGLVCRRLVQEWRYLPYRERSALPAAFVAHLVNKLLYQGLSPGSPASLVILATAYFCFDFDKNIRRPIEEWRAWPWLRCWLV